MNTDNHARYFMLDLAEVLGGERALHQMLLQVRRGEVTEANRRRLAEWSAKNATRLSGGGSVQEAAQSPYARMVDPIRGPACPVTPSKSNIAECGRPSPAMAEACRQTVKAVAEVLAKPTATVTAIKRPAKK